MYEVNFTPEQREAIAKAICGGAFAERQNALRALIEHNEGSGYSQIADNYEKELNSLLSAAELIVSSKSR